MQSESFKAENSDEIVWLRLNRLKSVTLCSKLIRKKLENSSVELDDEVIESKSIGLSAAIKSALGYLDDNSKNLNSKILSRYYFLLQLTIAEQVGSINNKDNLKSIQKHTEQGHGLGTIRDKSKSFPNDYYVFGLYSGHFYSYLKFLGHDPKEFSLERRPRDFNRILEKDKIVLLNDLFRRIPELNNVIEEHTGQTPLNFRIGHSSRIMEDQIDNMKGLIDGKKNVSENESLTKTTYISFYVNPNNVSTEYLESLNFPFYDYQIQEDPFSNSRHVIAKLDHTSKYWFEGLHIYDSTNSASSIIAPLWNSINDPVAINYALLYSLSIIVRYLPDLWYEIESGKHDEYGALIEYYIHIMDHIIPKLMLERITDSLIQVHQPGSIFGPI